VISCGLKTFFDDFFNYIINDLSVDQCNIFLINHDGGGACLVARNFLEREIPNRLAESYLNGKYEEDPNIKLLYEMSVGQTFTIHLSEYLDKISPAYREEFFSNPGFSDKVAIIIKGEHHSHYINLYRRAGKRRFRDDMLFPDHEGEYIISALITKHFSMYPFQILEGPLAHLSKREREVCEGILSGKKSETIAYDLGLTPNSVITYRRRSYQKLGINSRSALFSLCRLIGEP